jgi:hypothetical protein
MIDIERALHDSLDAYAHSIDPAPPPGIVELPAVDRRQFLGTVAAVALAGATVGGVWWLRRDRPNERSASGTAGPGRWSSPSVSPLSPRQFPAVFWTGDEFIVWGGVIGNTGLADGARYNPSTDSWRPMAASAAVRPGGAAAWAGDKMVVVSRFGAHAYDPLVDRWANVATLDGADSTTGFTDVVWTGTDLIALSIAQGSGGATLSAWHLENSTWAFDGSVAANGLPLRRYSTTADQIDVHDPVVLADGCALWDGQYNGWRFILGSGWTDLPALEAYDDQGALISESRLTVVRDELVIVATGRTAERDDLRTARLDGNVWSPWTVGAQRAVLVVARIVPVNDNVVLLGANISGAPVPLLIDPTNASATEMIGYPVEAVIDQGAGWSDSRLLVFGGQRSTPDSEGTTDNTDTVTAVAALWEPDA